MNILGTLYLMDNKDLVINSILNPARFTICMDTSETGNPDEDNLLSSMFPGNVQRATILNAPPKAVYAEIDGEHDKFIDLYNEYLDSPSVTDFIAAMLSHMHRGYDRDIIIYIPNYTEDAVWVNVLMINIFTRFGIHIGTSATDFFSYDQRYDQVIADTLYQYGYIDVFDYASSSVNYRISDCVYEKTLYELAPFCEPGEDPYSLFTRLKRHYLSTGVPITAPAVIFRQ